MLKYFCLFHDLFETSFTVVLLIIVIGFLEKENLVECLRKMSANGCFRESSKIFVRRFPCRTRRNAGLRRIDFFYPAIERRKLGINDEDMECIVEFFRWHIEQRNRRMHRQRIIAILKLLTEQLLNQKKFELALELEALQNFSK